MEKKLISSLLRVYHSDKTRFTSSVALSRFVDTYNIGHVKGASVVFAESDKQDIATLLQSTDGIDAASTTAESWDFLSRTESLALGANEKLTSATVRNDRVALKALKGKPLFVSGLEMHLPEGANLDIDWHLVSREHGHGSVLVVENWEAFEHIERTTFDLSAAGENPLVVFRGSPVYRQDHIHSMLEELHLPVYAFVDFDPAGLVIAQGLPYFTDLMSPGFAELQHAFKACKNTERYQSQLPETQAILNAATHPALVAHWQLQKTHGKALPQEYFLAVRL